MIISSDFLGDIAGLIVGKVVFTPEFGGSGEEGLEGYSGFRFYGWSTHKGPFGGYLTGGGRSKVGGSFALQAFYETKTKAVLTDCL